MRTWRHLDFFEHRAYLSARVPWVRCSEYGVRLVNVPWARPGSGFTLLFEVAVLTYAKQMPIAALARIVFGRCHVVAMANEAVDTVRRDEAKTRPELGRSRYAWLKNDANLTVKQREQLAWPGNRAGSATDSSRP